MEFTFPTIQYERPDLQKFADKAMELKMQWNRLSYEEAKEALKQYEKVQDHVQTMCTVVYIRHTVDTRDDFYEKENQYINQTMPTITPALLAFEKALQNSKFRKEFEAEYGKQMFVSMELQEKSFCEANIPLMQREAELTDEYQKIMAGAQIEFEGERETFTVCRNFSRQKTVRYARMHGRLTLIFTMETKSA